MLNLNIDIGHYLSDSGATYNKLREDNLCYLISHKLATLCKNNKNINVSFTDGTLNERTTKANNNNVDFFISIHINSTTGATGNEILVSRYATDTDKRFALEVLRNISRTTGLYQRGIRVDYDYLGYDLYVLKNTKMGAMLVECGFIQKDWSEQNKEELINKYANGIYDGLCKWYGFSQNICPSCGK